MGSIQRDFNAINVRGRTLITAVDEVDSESHSAARASIDSWQSEARTRWRRALHECSEVD